MRDRILVVAAVTARSQQLAPPIPVEIVAMDVNLVPNE